MGKTRNLCLAAATLSLAACSAPSVVEEWPNPSQRLAGFYDYGAGQRDLQLVVIGDPFAMSPEAFAQSVETVVQRNPSPRQPTYPKLHPGPRARSNYALIFAFGPTVRSQLPDDLCQMRVAPNPVPEPVDAGARPIRVLGAFCISGRAYSGAGGRAVVSGPDDPAFWSLMRQMMGTVFRPDLSDTGSGDANPF